MESETKNDFFLVFRWLVALQCKGLKLFFRLFGWCPLQEGVSQNENSKTRHEKKY